MSVDGGAKVVDVTAVVEQQFGVEAGSAATVRRRWTRGVAVLSIAMAVPYAVMGPGLLLDDWRWLEAIHFDGVLRPMGEAYGNRRPGQTVAVASTFGVIGPHPMALYLVQTALMCAVAVSILATLRRFMPVTVAGIVTVVWMVLPNHTSLSYFFSTANLLVALLFLLAGVRMVADGSNGWRSELVAAALFGVGSLFYEAVLPAAMLAAVAVPPLLGDRVRVRLMTLTALALSPMAALVLFKPVYSLDSELMDFARVLPLHFGEGISGPLGAATLTAALVGAIWVGWRGTEARRLIVAGAVVVAVGVAPFVKFDYRVVGHGDRATIVSGLGGAMVVTGLGLYLWARSRRLAVAVAVALAMALVPVHLERADNYRRATSDAVLMMRHIEDWPTRRGAPVFGPGERRHGGIPGLRADVVSSAFRLKRDDRTLDAYVSADASEYLAAPPERRVRWSEVFD